MPGAEGVSEMLDFWFQNQTVLGIWGELIAPSKEVCPQRGCAQRSTRSGYETENWRVGAEGTGKARACLHAPPRLDQGIHSAVGDDSV